MSYTRFYKAIGMLMKKRMFGSSTELNAQEKQLGTTKSVYTRNEDKCSFFGAKNSGESESTNTACRGCNDTIPAALRLPKIHSGKDYTVYETKMDEPYRNN